MKDELVGTVSHELRTPLTIVKGAIDNLREGICGPVEGKQKEVVELAHRNVERLARMINNLLDLSRLESGSARANKKPTDLSGVAKEVLDGFGYADTRGIKIDSRLDGVPPVEADAEMMAQVITNLLDNAVRFARARVAVNVTPEGGSVRVEVVDDGPGIPEDKIKDLFNKFTQLNRKAGGGYKGTGLGLAICKEIMTLHGTKIDVASVVGAGTRFSFALPVTKAAPKKRQEAPRS